MPSNLQEQILVRIVRLPAEVYSQREVARMLGVSQGCISNILRCKRITGRPHQRRHWGRRILTTAREDRQLVWMVRDKRSISAPRLSVAMIRRFRRRLPIQSIVNRSRHPARCDRLTLDHRGRGRVWGERTGNGTSATGSTVSLVMSLALGCFTGTRWDW